MAAPNLTDDDIREQERLVEKMKDENLEHTEWLDANQEFHMVLFRRAPNMRLVKMVNSERDKMRPYIAAASFALKRRYSADHAEILEACRKRDPELCAESTAKHLRQTERVLVEWLDRNED